MTTGYFQGIATIRYDEQRFRMEAFTVFGHESQHGLSNSDGHAQEFL
jgi:hypothetical protein